jgi:hypothetical protein
MGKDDGCKRENQLEILHGPSTDNSSRNGNTMTTWSLQEQSLLQCPSPHAMVDGRGYWVMCWLTDSMTVG